MCGIIAGIAQREIIPLLLAGLKRLEYRGYDSAGFAVLDEGQLKRLRSLGKIHVLEQAYAGSELKGHVGIAHTRWATHGRPDEKNAHPHLYKNDIALVHNGIIENYQSLRLQLEDQGAQFDSETDSETIVQLLGLELQTGKPLLQVVKDTLQSLEGAYALAMIFKAYPDRIVAARQGSPLVIGIGINEHFIASDSLALLPFTQKFVILEEGDIVEIFNDKFTIYDEALQPIQREVKTLALTEQSTSRGHYRHFMLKEIFEQPDSVQAALMDRFENDRVLDQVFGKQADEFFAKTQAIQIIACGSSYHAGLVAKFWIENILKIPCWVEIASELRYQTPILNAPTLMVAISQSGETADTLSAVQSCSDPHYVAKLAICNVAESSLVRQSQLALITNAGPEIGVASTKAFTTQLVALLLLVQSLGQRLNNKMQAFAIVKELVKLPIIITQILQMNDKIAELACQFDDKQHVFYIGRGIYYPIAKEGALKLKEISYIHAEAYPSGELKHGPLALIDKNMLVVALLPNDHMQAKALSNLQEIRSRQGKLIVFAQVGVPYSHDPETTCIEVPAMSSLLAPIAYSVLLQLLAYHVALRRGTDVDQPRNLAKSVTVE